MSRGLGETQFVSELPEVVVALAGLLTRLGDMWFLVAAIGVIFLLGRAGYSLTADPWRDCLVLSGLVIGSYSLTVVLKYVFVLPRPPGAGMATLPAWLPETARPVYEMLVTADGYGFPSGHAMQSTVAYGGGALLLTVWDQRRRFALASVIVFLVSVSRVLISVHYVVDVVVGALLGVTFLAVVVSVSDSRPERVLVIGAILSGLAFALSLTTNAALATVVAVGGLAAWIYTARSKDNAVVG